MIVFPLLLWLYSQNLILDPLCPLPSSRAHHKSLSLQFIDQKRVTPSFYGLELQ